MAQGKRRRDLANRGSAEMETADGCVVLGAGKQGLPFCLHEPGAGVSGFSQQALVQSHRALLCLLLLDELWDSDAIESRSSAGRLFRAFPQPVSFPSFSLGAPNSAYSSRRRRANSLIVWRRGWARLLPGAVRK